MANTAVCIAAFSQGGWSARVGDIVDTSSYLFVKFPTKFSQTDNLFAGTLGPVIKSSGGTLYRITVNDGGTLATVAYP